MKNGKITHDRVQSDDEKWRNKVAEEEEENLKDKIDKPFKSLEIYLISCLIQ
jgi:hypothetical protein